MFAQQQPRGIPARKSSPNNSPMASPREKVRPTTAPSRPNRENTRPTSPKTPKTGHFCRAGRTISRFPIRITPQGELFRAYPTRNEQSTRTTGLARTHETTCNYPPHPNREKTRPTTAPWHPRAKKFAQQQPRGIPARKSSPNNSPPTARPRQNSPSKPKNTENRPFLPSRAKNITLFNPLRTTGRISSR